MISKHLVEFLAGKEAIFLLAVHNQLAKRTTVIVLTVTHTRKQFIVPRMLLRIMIDEQR